MAIGCYQWLVDAQLSSSSKVKSPFSKFILGNLGEEIKDTLQVFPRFCCFSICCLKLPTDIAQTYVQAVFRNIDNYVHHDHG